MAKPILATPGLSGKQANEFIERMIVVEKSELTAYQKKMLAEIKANKEKFIISN